jgi:hypothetical protein
LLKAAFIGHEKKSSETQQKREMQRRENCMLLLFQYFSIKDHPFITSAKRLGGWVGSEKWLFLLMFSTIYADKGWVGQKKFKNVLA